MSVYGTYHLSKFTDTHSLELVPGTNADIKHLGGTGTYYCTMIVMGGCVVRKRNIRTYVYMRRSE